MRVSVREVQTSMGHGKGTQEAGSCRAGSLTRLERKRRLTVERVSELSAVARSK